MAVKATWGWPEEAQREISSQQASEQQKPPKHCWCREVSLPQGHSQCPRDTGVEVRISGVWRAEQSMQLG